ncbi:MAG: polyisoprenoid-binding protein [Emcibacter sp.]|nr:polyisoprenoid-binding protein [Emcibacter sp.]
MKAYFLTILLLLSPVAYAQDMPWQMKDGESSINFSVIIEGIASDGEFTKFTADIIFDPVSLDQSRIDILIDLDHIESFYSDVAINLKKKNWFDVAQYPTARFVSNGFKHLGGKDYQVTGELTLRDVTRTETLYFTLTQYDAQQAEIKGRMVLSRLDYGVGQGGWRDVSSVASQVFMDVVVRAER